MDEAGALQGVGETNYSQPRSYIACNATVHLHEDEEQLLAAVTLGLLCLSQWHTGSRQTTQQGFQPEMLMSGR